MATTRRRFGPAPKSLEERFWAKVNKDGPTMPGMDSPCWIWTGSAPGGYGEIGAGGHCGKMLRASRVALGWRLGRPLRPNEEACHRCDNPGCVRGDHLFPGTHSTNMQDCAAKGRLSAARFTPKNRGASNGRALLTEEQVTAIRTAPGSARKAAAEFGVSMATVYAIRQGRIWKHLRAA